MASRLTKVETMSARELRRLAVELRPKCPARLRLELSGIEVGELREHGRDLVKYIRTNVLMGAAMEGDERLTLKMLKEGADVDGFAAGTDPENDESFALAQAASTSITQQWRLRW